MSTNRRKFVQNLVGIGLGLGMLPSDAFAQIQGEFSNSNLPPNGTDDDFWNWVKQQYTASSTIINLNNGGVSPQPKVVQEAFERYTQLSNEAPSYYMWRILDKGRENLRKKLAYVAGCDTEELVITRNTTESLATVIFGLPLKKGDEVVLTEFDYPNMKQAWKQRAMREGIVLKWAKLSLPSNNDEEMVNAFQQQITSKTKLVHITHMVNWTGQILPVKKIADVAKQAGAEVLVDGAHTFAHLQFSIHDLNADYFGTSLHKWLCAPFGTGLLYIKKDKISKIWPAFAPPEPKSADIRKFEAQGTRSFAAEFAIAQAIDFHETIGAKRKQERLQYLKKYWLTQISNNKKIKSFTPIEPEYSCALATVAIEGKTRNEVVQELFNKYQIHTTNVAIENVDGVRITPHIYTSIYELDLLIKALNEISAS